VESNEDTAMSRRPYRTRQYLFHCKVCHTWQPIATLTAQKECYDRGACPRCQRDDGWLARVQVAAIEEHLQRLVQLGKAAPEADKPRYRALYRKKQAQLIAARARAGAAVDEVPV
jgi:hypothetical protein